MAEDTKRLRWWKLRPDGSYSGEPVWLEMPAHDHAFLTGLWAEIERTPDGPAKSRLVNELEVHLTLHACFPGGHYVEEEPLVVAPTPVPPSYLRRAATATRTPALSPALEQPSGLRP